MLETREGLTLEKRQVTHCDLCGGSDFIRWDVARGNQLDQCRDCGLVFTNPVFSNPVAKDHQIYDRTYFEQASRNTPELLEARRRSYQREFMALESVLQDKFSAKKLDILDVGCGTGIFLRSFDQERWRLFGCDISSWGLEQARQAGVSVWHGEMEHLDFGDQVFDVIYFRASLHHTRSPKVCLKRAQSLLKPEGIIVIAMSNNRSGVCGALFRGHIKSYEQGHNYLFDKKSLYRYLHESGFTVLKKDVPYFGTGYESFGDFLRLPLQYGKYLVMKLFSKQEISERQPDFASPTFYGNYLSVYAKRDH